MIYFLTFSIYFLNIINAFHRRKIKFLQLIFVVLLFVLMGGNTNNPDYHSYEIYYYNYGNVVSPDFGFRILNLIFNSVGISYEFFRIFISTISFYLINNSVKKYSNNPVFVYLLFAIYPFMLDVVQIRNFFMTAIIIYAMTYLVEKSYKNTYKFIILVLVAASIHISALVYLPIAWIIHADKNKFFKFSLFYAITIGILIGFNKSILEAITNPTFQYLSQYDSRFEVYSSINTRYGYFLYWALQLASFATIRWSKIIVNTNKLIDENKKKIVNLVYIVNTYMLLFLPFYVFEITYYRYARNIMILNYIVYSIAYKSIINNKHKRMFYVFLVIGLTLVYFYFCIFKPHNNNIVEPLFRYNWILK